MADEVAGLLKTIKTLFPGPVLKPGTFVKIIWRLHNVPVLHQFPAAATLAAFGL